MAVYQIDVWARQDMAMGKAGEKITITGEREVALATNGAPASKYIRIDADVGGKTEHTISDGFNWLGTVDTKKADEFLKEEKAKVKAAIANTLEAEAKAAHDQAEAIRATAAIVADSLEGDYDKPKGHKKKDK